MTNAARKWLETVAESADLAALVSRIEAMAQSLESVGDATGAKFLRELAPSSERWRAERRVIEAAQEVYEWLKRNRMEMSGHGQLLGEALAALPVSGQED